MPQQTTVPKALSFSRVLFFLCISLPACACGHTEAAAPDVSITTVMQAIHDYSRGHQVVPPVPSGVSLTVNEDIYQARIRKLLAEEKFDDLEKSAREARAGKSRAVGGVWLLFSFYDAVGKPPSGDRSQESDWSAHIATVKKWAAAHPDSAVAQLALANAFLGYGQYARGVGYADTVSDSAWEKDHTRTAQAKSILLQAAKLNEKDPFWYEAMQIVAITEGWDKAQARELFDQATAFEPTYYHYYREFGNFLLPKWYGDEGDTQAFAEEIAGKLPEPDASITYFEIASLVACECDSERDTLAGLSWPRIKQGYANLKNLYGTTNLKANRFAYMSFLAGDKAAARDAFQATGGMPNGNVWRTGKSFVDAMNWASSPDSQ